MRRLSDGTDDTWHVLLIQSSATPSRWLFPKGSVEANETVADAATRETREEGGVTGSLGPSLGRWNLPRGVHAMWVLFVHTEHTTECAQWAERDRRKRIWMSFEDARGVLTNVPAHVRRPELVEMLAAARAVLARVDANPPTKAVGGVGGGVGDRHIATCRHDDSCIDYLPVYHEP